jgi:hypothetical protein
LTSGHLGKLVALPLGDRVKAEQEVIGRQSGKPSGMMTPAPVKALSQYSLEIPRRFF